MSGGRIVFAASVAAVAGACAAAPPMLSEHQLCELWMAHELREITDGWDRRLALNVTCDAPLPGGGFILATVAPAAGQETLSDSEIRELRQRIVTALEAAVERRGWGALYPSRTVEYAPPPSP